MKTSNVRRASVVPALLALGLAACGSDSSESDATTPPADTSASTDEPMTTDMSDIFRKLHRLDIRAFSV